MNKFLSIWQLQEIVARIGVFLEIYCFIALTFLFQLKPSAHHLIYISIFATGASAMPEEGNQSSPLHRAAAHGHEATVKLLLEYCNIGATEETGRNSLDLAIDYNKKLGFKF